MAQDALLWSLPIGRLSVRPSVHTFERLLWNPWAKFPSNFMWSLLLWEGCVCVGGGGGGEGEGGGRKYFIQMVTVR